MALKECRTYIFYSVIFYFLFSNLNLHLKSRVNGAEIGENDSANNGKLYEGEIPPGHTVKEPDKADDPGTGNAQMEHGAQEHEKPIVSAALDGVAQALGQNDVSEDIPVPNIEEQERSLSTEEGVETGSDGVYMDIGFKNTPDIEPRVDVSGIAPSDTATPSGTPTVRAPNGEDTDAPDELHEPPSLELGEEEENTVGDPPPPEVVEKELAVVEIPDKLPLNPVTTEDLLKMDVVVDKVPASKPDDEIPQIPLIPGNPIADGLQDNVEKPQDPADSELVPPPQEEEVIIMKETEDMPSFDEWKEKMLKEQVEQEKILISEDIPATNGDNINNKNTNKKLANKNRPNYAAASCGAKLLASNSEAQNPAFILSENKDMYMIQPCKAAKKWFVVELCEPVVVDYLELGNQELFSSLPERFAVHFSDRYPAVQWKILGTFNARDERTIQTFQTQHELYAKYLKVEMLSFYGKEHYCPLSLLRVFGSDLHEDESEEEAPPPDAEADGRSEEMLAAEGGSSDGEKKDRPNNLFNSAKDTVMSLVKTVLNGNGENGVKDTGEGALTDITDVQANSTQATDGQKAGPCEPEGKVETNIEPKPCETFPPNRPVAPDALTEKQTPESPPLVWRIENPNMPLAELIKRCEYCDTESQQNRTTWDKSTVCGYYRNMVYVYPTSCRPKPVLNPQPQNITITTTTTDDVGEDVDQEMVRVIEGDSLARGGGEDSCKQDEQPASNTKGDSAVQEDKTNSLREDFGEKKENTKGQDIAKPDIKIQPSGKTAQDQVDDEKGSTTTDPASLKPKQDSITPPPVNQGTPGTKPPTEPIIAVDKKAAIDNEEGAGDSGKDVDKRDDNRGDDLAKVGEDKEIGFGSEGVGSNGGSVHGPETVQVRPTDNEGGNDLANDLANDLDSIKSAGDKVVDSKTTGELDSTHIPATENSDKSDAASNTTLTPDQPEQNKPGSQDSNTMRNADSESTQNATVDGEPNGEVKQTDDKKKDLNLETDKQEHPDPPLAEADKIIYADESPPTDSEETGSGVTHHDDAPVTEGDVNIQRHRSQMKETTYMKLKNKIRELEINLTLSSRYLEELSKKYKQRMEDMYISLNKTIQKLTNTSKAAEIRDNRQQERIGFLERRLDSLTTYTVNVTHKMDSIHSDVIERHFYILVIEVIVFMCVMGWCLAKQKSHYKERLRTVSNSYFNATSPPVALNTPAKGHRRGLSVDMNTPKHGKGSFDIHLMFSLNTPAKGHRRGVSVDMNNPKHGKGLGVTSASSLLSLSPVSSNTSLIDSWPQGELKKSGSENDITVIEPNMDMLFAWPSGLPAHRKRKKKKGGVGALGGGGATVGGVIGRQQVLSGNKPAIEDISFSAPSQHFTGMMLNGETTTHNHTSHIPNRELFYSNKNSHESHSIVNDHNKRGNPKGKPPPHTHVSHDQISWNSAPIKGRNSSKDRSRGNSQSRNPLHHSPNEKSGGNPRSQMTHQTNGQHVSKNKFALLQDITPLKQELQKANSDSETIVKRRNSSISSSKRNLEMNFPKSGSTGSEYGRHVDRDAENINNSNLTTSCDNVFPDASPGRQYVDVQNGLRDKNSKINGTPSNSINREMRLSDGTPCNSYPANGVHDMDSKRQPRQDLNLKKEHSDSISNKHKSSDHSSPDYSADILNSHHNGTTDPENCTNWFSRFSAKCK